MERSKPNNNIKNLNLPDQQDWNELSIEEKERIKAELTHEMISRLNKLNHIYEEMNKGGFFVSANLVSKERFEIFEKLKILTSM